MKKRAAPHAKNEYFMNARKNDGFMRVCSLFLLLAMLFLLTACYTPTCTEHIDGNGDGICDVCSVVLEASAGNTEGNNNNNEIKDCSNGHTFDQKKVSNKYIVSVATCTSPATYHYSCSVCGEEGNEIFEYGDLKAHAYSNTVTGYTNFASKDGDTLTFYKSCINCGTNSTETFTKTVENAAEYTIESPTVTLYSTSPLEYGFTWTSTVQPLIPILQIKKQSETEYTDIIPEVSTYSTLNNRTSKTAIPLYVTKTAFACEAGSEYTYRLYDKGFDKATEEFTFTAVNPSAEKFTFVSISDSQSNELGAQKQGYWFRQVLKSTTEADFYIHTGDVVEYSMYNQDFSEMLDYNREYLAEKPVMAVSGNHDTDQAYYAKGFELEKHFNYNLNGEPSGANGFYYSFEYGDVKFIAINSNENQTSGISAGQYNWLVSELENNTKKWVIVYMHCPLYSEGQWGADGSSRNTHSIALRTQLAGLFAEYGVDLVVQGHDHLVTKTHAIAGYDLKTNQSNIVTETIQTINGIKYSVNPGGVIYVMNGPTGNETKPRAGINVDNYDYVIDEYVCSWAEYEVDGDKLTVTAKYYDISTNQVKTYTSYGIIKN